MIKLLVMDVDGTLTDGKIYMGVQGELVKAFDVKDGYGIKEQLPRYGIVPVIITARTSKILQNRCKELGITELYQGVRDKVNCLSCVMEQYGVQMNEVAYIGDDILDLQCLIPIRQHGGLSGCPANAAPQVVSNCDFVSSHEAGAGAVRDFIEYIISRNSTSTIGEKMEQRLKNAVEFIDNLKDVKEGCFQVSSDFYYNVIEYVPKESKDVLYESHRKYIDIQRILDGEEFLMVSDVSTLVPCSPYDEEKDFLNYSGETSPSGVLFRKGSSIVLFPKDGHKAVRYGSSDVTVRKIVGKLLINP